MDKATVWLIRFTFEFIIFGEIFGALWRVFYVKNIERQELMCKFMRLWIVVT